jgi:hypothetical protein
LGFICASYHAAGSGQLGPLLSERDATNVLLEIGNEVDQRRCAHPR